MVDGKELYERGKNRGKYKIKHKKEGTKNMQTSRKVVAAGSFGRKEIHIRLSFVNSELA